MIWWFILYWPIMGALLFLGYRIEQWYPEGSRERNRADIAFKCAVIGLPSLPVIVTLIWLVLAGLSNLTLLVIALIAALAIGSALQYGGFARFPWMHRVIGKLRTNGSATRGGDRSGGGQTMQTITVATLMGDGKFRYDIVGESYHQDNIARIVGGKTEKGWHFPCHAVLLPDRLNRSDRNAVAVAVDGIEAGYIRAVDCVEFEKALAAIGASAAECEARIVGGWSRGPDDEGSFGVKLDAILPFRFSNPRPISIAANLPG